jgi:hypothetical protein
MKTGDLPGQWQLGSVAFFVSPARLFSQD